MYHAYPGRPTFSKSNRARAAQYTMQRLPRLAVYVNRKSANNNPVNFRFHRILFVRHSRIDFLVKLNGSSPYASQGEARLSILSVLGRETKIQLTVFFTRPDCLGFEPRTCSIGFCCNSTKYNRRNLKIAPNTQNFLDAMRILNIPSC